MRETNINNLKIADGEKLYIDGVELKSVESYQLTHSAGETAELTVKLEVNVNKADFE